MYNVQLSEFWKQRVGRENVHNSPAMLDLDDDDTRSVLSDASSLRAPSESAVSTTSSVTRVKIQELEEKLESERKKRVEVENQLKQMKTGSIGM